MPKILNFFVKIVTNLAIIILLSLEILSPALAITQQLQFQTRDGHTIKTVFSYDAKQAKQILKEHGKGKTEIVDNLQVNFYQPSGELIASYNNIVNGIAQGTYFEFSFNPVTKQLSGSIDLGGESPGEIYLKGEGDRDLWLIEVDETGAEKVISQVFSSNEEN